MSRAIDVTLDPVLERWARILFFKLSRNHKTRIDELKWLALSRGLDPFANPKDLANLLTVVSFYADEKIIEPALDSDLDRKTWRDYLSGDLEGEQLLDRIQLQFRRGQRERYGKNQIGFLRVLDR